MFSLLFLSVDDRTYDQIFILILASVSQKNLHALQPSVCTPQAPPVLHQNTG